MTKGNTIGELIYRTEFGEERWRGIKREEHWGLWGREVGTLLITMVLELCTPETIITSIANMETQSIKNNKLLAFLIRSTIGRLS